MSLQSAKAQLLAVSLVTLSTCGTLALFGSVPVIARMLADLPGQQATPLPLERTSTLP
jgi:hypothetical protein